MKQYEVIIMPKALLQIERLYDIIAYRFYSPITADRQCDRIRKVIRKLSTFPMRRPVVFLSNQGEEVRRIYVDNFSVFYIIREELGEVHVVDVLKSTFDFEQLLKEDDYEMV